MMALDAYEARVLARARAELELDILNAQERLVDVESIDFADIKLKIGIIKGIKHALAKLSDVEQEFRREETGQESQKQHLSRYED